MYEREFLIAGVWIGYFATVFAILLFTSVALALQEDKFYKFLLHTGQHQKFEEWKFKEGVTLKFIKNGK